ncbi:MAG: cytochrome c oxidase subunit II [Actinomycetota bacterium]|nr:cytochrome c oxidase subunit II [Acidimicrobiales bacterium]MEC7898964.1 cytochrome c oxidase subunit II [Actinomycetota bacterium]|tara:strand:- start:13436 stop:14626 length:1191 start_codon:yes stop_codon:yes gene_type:complete
MMQKYFKFPVFLLSVLVFVSSCSSGAELDTLKPKGPTSRSIDALSDPVFLIAGIVFVIIFGGTALLWIRFRDDHSDDEFPEQVHGNFNLEILWTLIPTLILAGVAVFTLITLSEINDSDNNVMALSVDGQSVSWEPEVVVVGQQWWWEYRYYLDGLEGVDLSDARNLPPADIVTSTQMVIPTGEEIELKITSRDVIHSHWIPALNGKRDAVPGRVSPWKIEADEPGVYFGQCTEFCGLSHARMRMQVVAMEPDEFQEWVNQQSESANEPKTETEKRGLEIFESLCARCHVINGVNDQTSKGADLVSNAAPNLTHLMSRTTFAGGIFNMYEPNGSLNRTQLEAWLRNAPDEKPAYAEGRRGMPNMGLDESQIDDLIAYLETLGEKPKIEIISATEVE